MYRIERKNSTKCHYNLFLCLLIVILIINLDRKLCKIKKARSDNVSNKFLKNAKNLSPLASLDQNSSHFGAKPGKHWHMTNLGESVFGLSAIIISLLAFISAIDKVVNDNKITRSVVLMKRSTSGCRQNDITSGFLHRQQIRAVVDVRRVGEMLSVMS